MGFGDFLQEARGQGTLPRPMHPPVGGEAGAHTLSRPRQPDIGQAPFFLQPRQAVLVHGALAGKQSFLPARQKHCVELQPLGGMQRHQIDAVAAFVLGDFHHQADMLQEPRQGFKTLHRADEFLEVVQPPRRFRRLVGLQHVGIAAFLQHHLGQFGVRQYARRLAPAREVGRQRGQGLARLGRQFVRVGDLARRRQQRQMAGAGVSVQRRHRRIADAALGFVDDALEGQVVIALRDQAQIGHGVADFRPLIEARAADDAIGQPQTDETVFEFAHLKRRAHQDRHLAIGMVLPVQIFRRGGDVAGFFFRVPHAFDADFLAGIAFRPQRLAQPSLVGGDQAGGGAQDHGGGAVIALQPHHPGAGKVALEAQDVFHFGAAPAIDRLVVIAHDADVARRRGQQLQPEILHHIGVLILVHQHVAEAVAVIGQDVGMGAQDVQRFQQQIAEIRRVQRPQAILILAIEQLALAEGISLAFAVGNIVGAQAPVLPAIDHRRQGAGRPALFVHAFGRDQLLHQAQLVVGIQDGEVGFQARQFGMAAQHPGADGMESAQPLHPFHHAADQGADALLHLAGGLVGEGDGQDLPRPGAPCGQDMRQPRGQHAGLAGARARQHQHRAVHGFHGQALLRVQTLEIVWLARHRRLGIAAERRIQRVGIAVAKVTHESWRSWQKHGFGGHENDIRTRSPECHGP